MVSAVVSLVVLSCKGDNGVDGTDGQAFVTVTTSDGSLYAYVDDNTSRPGSFNAGQAYRVIPGSYNFAYESRIYTSATTYYYAQWTGVYSVHLNRGEKGTEGKIFWQKGSDGKDGADSYLILLCNFDGPLQTRINKRLNAVAPAVPDSSITVENIFGDYTMKVEYTLKSYGKK